GVVADDHAGIGIAFGRVGIGVVGELRETDHLVGKVGLRCELLAHVSRSRAVDSPSIIAAAGGDRIVGSGASGRPPAAAPGPMESPLDPLSLVALVVLGTVTGFLAGLLGLGGGMIIGPFMSIVLDRGGLDRDLVLKLAIATSLTTIRCTSMSSVRAHRRRGAVRWDIVRTLAPGIVAGSLAAAQIVRFTPSRWIALFFGAFIAWTAVNMLRRRPKGRVDAPERGLPGNAGMFGAGGAIGALSAFLGAGGGFLTVPFLA